MKVVIVNCFDTYEERVKLIRDFFKEQGDEVSVISSDFSHSSKKKREIEENGFFYLKTRQYKKNLSFKRLKSHQKFSEEAFMKVKEIEPDVLYILVPPNSLVKQAALYKKKYPKVKIILDIIDLWPETLPLKRGKNLFPISAWKNIRSNYVNCADLIITECDLYQEVLVNELRDIPQVTLHLAKNKIQLNKNVMLSNEKFDIAYLGSINNIVDIDQIVQIINNLLKVRPVTLHVIGNGESKDTLINSVAMTGAKIKYYGIIYDEKEKQDIFSKCHYGLNIMKQTVCVGLTMKSIDYFQHGLPILNNIQADTTRIVENYSVGINISDGFNALNNLNDEYFLHQRIQVKTVFDEHFSIEAFNKKLETIYKENLKYEK
ncbi:hypothetical protein [Exiguobacterium sp. SL-9]|uniref:hypothetical protein n=1 Tax=Exiguobacterium sp. SL-9 TaxID=2510963 RepID=UPI001038C074|nr:hypothetical protein [Exiguobacterium sp. SL-9]TCI21718.1 hypothetical protein EVJ34_10725 [Exiguobacterium sp. SL-9]